MNNFKVAVAENKTNFFKYDIIIFLSMTLFSIMK